MPLLAPLFRPALFAIHNSHAHRRFLHRVRDLFAKNPRPRARFLARKRAQKAAAAFGAAQYVGLGRRVVNPACETHPSRHIKASVPAHHDHNASAVFMLGYSAFYGLASLRLHFSNGIQSNGDISKLVSRRLTGWLHRAAAAAQPPGAKCIRPRPSSARTLADSLAFRVHSVGGKRLGKREE